MSATSVGSSAPSSSYANEFYITLPSNSSLDIFPENRTNSYRVKLAQPVSLPGKWEVGLAEIQYPHTWNTIEKLLEFEYHDPKSNQNHRVSLVPGHYPSVEAILENIRSRIVEDVQELYKFEYDKVSRRVSIYVRRDGLLKFASPDLSVLLGFDWEKQNRLKGSWTYHGQYPPDLKIGRYGLFVYTDVIVPVPVGGASVPLLRIVPVDGVDGDIVTKTYDKPHYVPVKHNYFDTVEIDISRDTGERIQFEFGKVVVKLHFRPRRLAYL